VISAVHVAAMVLYGALGLQRGASQAEVNASNSFQKFDT
jgi:hypothetical protein